MKRKRKVYYFDLLIILSQLILISWILIHFLPTFSNQTDWDIRGKKDTIEKILSRTEEEEYLGYLSRHSDWLDYDKEFLVLNYLIAPKILIDLNRFSNTEVGKQVRYIIYVSSENEEDFNLRFDYNITRYNWNIILIEKE